MCRVTNVYQDIEQGCIEDCPGDYPNVFYACFGVAGAPPFHTFAE